MSSLLIHMTLVDQYGVSAKRWRALLVGGITLPPSLCPQGTEQDVALGVPERRTTKMMVRSSRVADGTWTVNLNTDRVPWCIKGQLQPHGTWITMGLQQLERSAWKGEVILSPGWDTIPQKEVSVSLPSGHLPWGRCLPTWVHLCFLIYPPGKGSFFLTGCLLSHLFH